MSFTNLDSRLVKLTMYDKYVTWLTGKIQQPDLLITVTTPRQ